MDSRPSLQTLNRDLRIINDRIPQGSYWRHQKSRNVYEVVCISAAEKDGEPEVVFRPVPNPNCGPVIFTVMGEEYDSETGDQLFPFVVHHRPVSEWEELVDIDGDLCCDYPRFKRVQRTTVFA